MFSYNVVVERLNYLSDVEHAWDLDCKDVLSKLRIARNSLN